MTGSELFAALVSCSPAPRVKQRDSDYGDLDQVLTWQLGTETSVEVTLPPTGAGLPTYEVSLPRGCSISGTVTGDGSSLWTALELAGILRGRA